MGINDFRPIPIGMYKNHLGAVTFCVLGRVFGQSKRQCPVGEGEYEIKKPDPTPYETCVHALQPPT